MSNGAILLPVMASCPLCSARSAKRYCPAKGTQICPVCCGTKREIEIDCPGSCPYLKASYSYEDEKRVPDAEMLARVRRISPEFLERFSFAIDDLTQAVIAERLESPWLVDQDVMDVYGCLASTLKTLSKGIYYESLPVGPVRLSLFRRLKLVVDELIEHHAELDQPALKISEALDILDFLLFSAHMNSSSRPRSRRYLDWLSSISHETGAERESSRLILP
jgi:hypothetical protein